MTRRGWDQSKCWCAEAKGGLANAGSLAVWRPGPVPGAKLPVVWAGDGPRAEPVGRGRSGWGGSSERSVGEWCGGRGAESPTAGRGSGRGARPQVGFVGAVVSVGADRWELGPTRWGVGRGCLAC